MRAHLVNYLASPCLHLCKGYPQPVYNYRLHVLKQNDKNENTKIVPVNYDFKQSGMVYPFSFVSTLALYDHTWTPTAFLVTPKGTTSSAGFLQFEIRELCLGVTNRCSGSMLYCSFAYLMIPLSKSQLQIRPTFVIR